MPADEPPQDFSDSDQAWFDRLTGPAAAATPPDSARREAALLQRALARRRAMQPADDTADAQPKRPDIDAALGDAAQARRWARLQTQLHGSDAASPPATPASLPLLQSQPDADAARTTLRPAAAQPLPPRWSWRWLSAGGGALAAAVLLAVVVAQRPDGSDRIYDEPPLLGQRGDTTVQRLATDQPRQAAEALHHALRQAGEPAALHQHGRVFIVLLQVSSETTPPALAALRAAGVTVTPGPMRVEFWPR